MADVAAKSAQHGNTGRLKWGMNVG